MEDLCGVGPGGQQRVISLHFGVSVSRTLFGVSKHFGDGRIQIDDQTVIPRAGTQSPHPFQGFCDHESSWRTWPKVKARRNVPNVEGAATRNGRIRRASFG